MMSSFTVSSSPLVGQSLLDRMRERGMSDADRFAELTAICDELMNGVPVSFVPPDACPDCDGVVIENDGAMVCCGCMRIMGSVVDRSAESRGFFDDNRRNPIERSDVPVNPLYPKSSSASTVHVDRRGNSGDYNSMRLAKRSGMHSKDRPRDVVFKLMDTVCFNHKLSNAVIASAKHYYLKVSSERTSRGGLKKGLIAACVYFACQINDAYKPEDVVAAMFNVTTSQIIQGKSLVNQYLKLPVKPPTATKLVVAFARNLALSLEHTVMCERVCERASQVDALAAYVPRSLAAGAIMLVCDAFELRGKKDVMAAVSVSALTLTKVTADMEAVIDEVFPRVEVALTVEEGGACHVDVGMRVVW